MNAADPRLRELFDERGKGVRLTVDDLADRAIARERRDHRRRVGVAVVAGATALAVAVPVTWASLRPHTSTQVPAGPTSSTTDSPSPSTPVQSPSPSSTPMQTPSTLPTIQATGAPNAARVVLASGPATAPTDLGYVTEGVYHEGALRITLPAGLTQPNWVSRLGDGLLVDVNGTAFVVAADGSRGRQVPATSSFVVDEDRTHYATTDRDGSVVYGDASGTVATLKNTGAGTYSPRGIVGTRVYLLTNDQTKTVVWDTVTGRTTTMTGATELVNGRAGLGLRALPTKDPGNGDAYCQELVDLASGAAFWRLCGPLHFTHFSPDGAYLVGGIVVDGLDPARTSRTDYETLVVLRTVDHEVVLMGGGDGTDQTAGGVVAARMGEDHSLTLETWAGTERGLQRCDLQGRCAVVAPLKAVSPSDPESASPYVLAGP